jgi:anti-anti-sigma factor
MTNINERMQNIGLGANAIKLKEKFEGQIPDTSRYFDEDTDQNFDKNFDFIERQKGEFTVFAIKGRLGNGTAKFFKDQIYKAASEDGCKVIIYLGYTSLIDSIGLGVLINAHKKAERMGGMVVFSNVPERIMKNLKMLYMDRYLHFAPNMKTAASMMDW